MAKKAAKAGKARPAAKAKAKAKAKGSKGALVGGVGVPNRQDQSISIRKIANGYVTSQSGYRGDKYVSRETFTASKPKLVIGGNAE